MFKNDLSTFKRFLIILLSVMLVTVPSMAYATTWLNVTNNATSTLTSTMTAGSLSFTVTTGEGALFPTSNFLVTIDDEIILVSSRSSDNFTVGARASENTTAAAHAIGAAVNLNVTAGIIQQIQSAVDNVTVSLTTNYLPKFNGTGLVNSSVSDNGTHTAVSDNLAVTGSLTASNIPSGTLVTTATENVTGNPASGYLVKSSGSGVIATATNTDAQVANVVSKAILNDNTTVNEDIAKLSGKTPVTTDNTSLNSTIANTGGISRSGTTTTISDNLSTKHLTDNATGVYYNGIGVLTNNTDYFSGTGNENIASILTNQMIRVPLQAVSDQKSMISNGDWYGASGNYTQANSSGCSATQIIKTGANFTGDIQYALVKWASNAAGSSDTGYGAVTAYNGSDNISISKFSGTNFTNSYYFWIKHSEITVATSGTYILNAGLLYLPAETSKRFDLLVYEWTGSAWSQKGQSYIYSATDSLCPVYLTRVVNLTAGRKIVLIAYHLGTSGTPTMYTTYGNAYLEIFLLKAN